MKAYHNDPALKAATIARMKAHREADQLVKGLYWKNGKGCAIGCLYHSADHTAGEREHGFPEWLMWLVDRTFEGLSEADAQLWPERFLAAIPIGADLDMIQASFLAWLMLDPDWGVIRFAGNNQDVRAAIERVGALWRDGGVENEFAAARAAAQAATGNSRQYAQWQVTWAAEAAASAAAGNAETAAWAATAAAVEAAAGNAAEATQWLAIADKLISLLEECK